MIRPLGHSVSSYYLLPARNEDDVIRDNEKDVILIDNNFSSILNLIQLKFQPCHEFHRLIDLIPWGQILFLLVATAAFHFLDQPQIF